MELALAINHQPVHRTGAGPGARAVGSFVPNVTRKAFEKYGFAAATILTNWAEIVGAETAACTRPERLKWPRKHEAAPDGADPTAPDGGARRGATIVLRVEPSRALDIQYQSAQLLDRINAYFGYRAVWELRILQAPLAPAPPEATPPHTVVNTHNRDAAIGARAPAPAGGKLAAALTRLQANVAQSAARRARR